MRNYEVSREGKFDLGKKINNPKKVLIIGSGPAGLEAARVAKILGHDVTILEKKNKIGGQANVSYAPPGRHDIKEIVTYYKAQIDHLNIDLQLGVEATEELINEYHPDAVIFATGVKYSIPEIPGIDGSLGSTIYAAEDVLFGKYPVGKNIVVVGGSATGMETAIWAAELGALDSEVARFIALYELIPKDEIFNRWLKGNRNVTLIEMLPKLGLNVGRTTRGFLIGHIMKLGINIITNANITKFEGKTVEFNHAGESKSLDNIDTFILATGVKPNTKLHDKIKASNPFYKIYKIGDCKKARTMMEAIHEVFKTAFKQSD
jgi:2,4-dienoyl-CoA reductase (NADPH2)